MNTISSYRTKIVNRVEYNDTLASNLVYPLDKGYHMVMKCDKDFVETRLRREFGLDKVDTDVIQNKYVIRVSFMGTEDILVYNQNGNYWIVRKDRETTLQNIVDKF